MTTLLNILPIHLNIKNHLKTYSMTDRFLAKTLLARLLFILVLSGGFSTYSFAQSAGTLDTSFGVNGKVITPIDTISDKGYSIAIQSDDKIILGGSTKNSYTSSDFALLRYNNDGTMDNTFGTGGKVITPIATQSEGYSIAIQNDGKILLGGADSWNINLVRYNNDGSLDTTFGIGGIVITDIPGYYSEKCKSVAIQSDGKIIIGGFAANASNDLRHFVLLKYNSNGSLDTAFGAGGTVIGGLGECQSLKIQNDGKIVLGGTSNFSFAVERYNSNGIWDTTFGIAGKVTTSIGLSSSGNSMDVQVDGKIVLGGHHGLLSNSSAFALVRYLSDGSLDNSFGIGGIVTTPVGTSSKGNSVVIQSDGKIILAGNSENGSNIFDFTLVRYNSNGTLDATFGVGGKTITPIGISYSSVESVGIDSNGKILLGGYAYNRSSVEMALVRYHSNASVGIGSFKQIDNKIYPNPFNSSTTILFSTPLHNAELNIYNAYGQLVNHLENISGQNIQLSRNNLPSGIYFFQLTENNKIIGADKLIISDE
jgi:uncharacterized delta-60 repeat protein